MKIFIKMLLTVIAVSMVFCLCGCENGKSEEDYKSAISAHMRSEHNHSVSSYITFDMKPEGGASAWINVAVPLEMGVSYEMRNVIYVNKDCNVYSCNFCDLGW